ncbi:MAG: B12-binding domain-containing radical SAM protein [Spirochaetia bacterium]|nr:B12-binding domain-containing radical SAM protein [Spirochaetia bacterium]
MKKILFVTAPFHTGGVHMAGQWPPLYMIYLAGAARDAGAEAKIYDAMTLHHDYNDISKEIKKYNPDIVMTMDYLPVTGTLSTASVPAAIKILETAKEVNSDILTVISGTHPTFMYEEMLNNEPYIDYIIRGEGEAVLQNIIKADSREEINGLNGVVYSADGGIVKNPREELIVDIDSLNPAWDLIDWNYYKYNVDPPGGRLASVLTSRGCDMSCSFCSQRLFWDVKWRPRKAEKVVEEIETLKNKYDVNVVTFIDAYPTKDRQRWETILDLLIEKDLGVYFLLETRVDDILRDKDILHKYKKAKILHVYMGAESGDEEILEKINKGITIDQVHEAINILREAQILTEASFMVGFPEETWDSINKTIEMAKKLNPDVAVFPVYTPWPYTPEFKQYKDRIRVFDYSKYNILDPVIEPYEMSLSDVDKAVGMCYRDFYKEKMKEVIVMKDELNKEYLLSAFKIMMKDFKSTFKEKNIDLNHPV